MYFEKAKRQSKKSEQKFLDKAKDCQDLANALHSASDQQHKIAESKNDTSHAQHHNAFKLNANANKLDKVSEALVADAVELKGELAMDAEHPQIRK